MLRLKDQACIEKTVDDGIVDLHISDRHVHNVRLCARVLLVLVSAFKGVLLHNKVIEAASKGPHVNSRSHL